MRVTRASQKKISSNTRFKLDSDNEDFESPVFEDLNSRSEQKSSDESNEESEKSSDENDVNDLVSDDEGPDSISFSTSRTTAVAQIKETLKQIHDEKSKQKIKRKQKDDLYKEQKRTKLQKLASSKLPDDILDSLTNVTETKPPEKCKHVAINESGEKRHIDAPKNEHIQENDNFIPLERLQDIEVVSLKSTKQNYKSLAQKAEEFRQKHLYGGKIKRESFEDLKARREKHKTCY